MHSAAQRLGPKSRSGPPRSGPPLSGLSREPILRGLHLLYRGGGFPGEGLPLTLAISHNYLSCFARDTTTWRTSVQRMSWLRDASIAVKVGFLVSGDRITYPNGARIAVDEVNERGGLLGRSVELVIQMDLQEAEAAVQAAETMILTDEVVALIGPNRSSHAIEVGAVAQSHGVPMVTTAATNPAVTEAGDLVFMAAFTDQFQGRVMAQFASETRGDRSRCPDAAGGSL